MPASVWFTAQNAQPKWVCQWRVSLNCSHAHAAHNARGQPTPLTHSYAPTHCWMALLHSVSVPANFSPLGDTRFSRNTPGFTACKWTEIQGPFLEQVFLAKGSSQNTHLYNTAWMKLVWTASHKKFQSKPWAGALKTQSNPKSGREQDSRNDKWLTLAGLTINWSLPFPGKDFYDATKPLVFPSRREPFTGQHELVV